ncbi:LysM peptidoglycan-binding domain-containing protein [Actinomadura macrotermitis]|uniref:LysM domain-containing protein n=1 Tax=Actinomadura macrotermitis TaxID=2585200 RepID=A0A7K0C4P7_9ACTN|nr:LysM peptidoglycan-binding domain-containing protein [Actinomadura macrotermitis]MQY08378.1 hypothetical protein [Actinomadura macrotermitis]
MSGTRRHTVAYGAAGRCGPARAAGGARRPVARRVRLADIGPGEIRRPAPARPAAARPAPPAREPAGLRLTRRGRVVLISFAAGVLLLILWLAAGHWAQARSGGARPVNDQAPGGPKVYSVVVEPGETLWEIAVRADPHADPRVTVRRITDLNGLSGSIIQPGQRLRVPVR